MARHRSDRSKRERPTPAEPAEKFGEEAADDEPAWIQQASARYEARQQRYADMLSGARASLEKNKEGLADLLRSQTTDEEETPPPPPIFDEAARAYQERQKSLGSMFEDAIQARQRERDALTQMFGPRAGKKPPRR